MKYKYVKSNPRIETQFVDGAEEEILFEVNTRTHIDVGELHSNYIASQLTIKELEDDELPDELLVISISRFKKVNA